MLMLDEDITIKLAKHRVVNNALYAFDQEPYKAQNVVEIADRANGKMQICLNVQVILDYIRDANKVWTAALYDADQKYYYLKRFQLEAGSRKQNFLGENPKSRLMLLTDEAYPRIEAVFGGHDAFREPLVLDAEEFIAVKGFKAKGKRISTFDIETINELDPVRFAPAEQPQEQNDDDGEDPDLDPDADKSNSDIIDEITGQMKLF
jgi:topoisomerase-4 subunit A